MKKYYCINCKKELNNKSIRCLVCHNIFKHETRKRYFCKECKKEITSNGIRCQSCAKKGNQISRIDGRSTMKHYCLDCEKEIWYTSIRCKKCSKQGELHSLFGKKFTKESKSRMSLVRGGTGVPYEKNDYPNKFYELRNIIRKRDNYKCHVCNKKGNFVHHIDYIKNNCKETNLITLCNNCHSKTNFNRIYWKNFFSNLINKIKLCP